MIRNPLKNEDGIALMAVLMVTVAMIGMITLFPVLAERINRTNRQTELKTAALSFRHNVESFLISNPQSWQKTINYSGPAATPFPASGVDQYNNFFDCIRTTGQLVTGSPAGDCDLAATVAVLSAGFKFDLISGSGDVYYATSESADGGQGINRNGVPCKGYRAGTANVVNSVNEACPLRAELWATILSSGGTCQRFEPPGAVSPCNNAAGQHPDWMIQVKFIDHAAGSESSFSASIIRAQNYDTQIIKTEYPTN